MTVKEMAKECKKIWMYVLKTGEEKTQTKYENNCPACQYAVGKSDYGDFYLEDMCGKCPLLKLWGKDFNGKKEDITPCQDSLSSPYRIYYTAYELPDSDDKKDLFRCSATMIIKYLEKTYKV